MRPRFRQSLPFFIAFFILISFARAQQITDPLALIGIWEEAASALWEDPEEILKTSGPSDREIYFPSRGVTLGIHGDRVWQVRFDETTPMSWRGLGPGVPRERVREILGSPYHAVEPWDLYLLPGRSWPLRLRIFYRTGEAFDFYLYRGDF